MMNAQLFLGISLTVMLSTSGTTAPPDRSISGTVRDPAGKPIGKIALILASTTSPEDGSENKLRRITVNADGSFAGSVPEGDYRIVGTSPSCFAARDLTLAEGENLSLILEWRSNSTNKDKGDAGGTSASFNIGFSAGPTTLNLLRVGNLAGGIRISTQGVGAGVGINLNRSPNGGGIAVDPEPECGKWKPAAQ
jgi:hypothetical protein